MQHCQRRTDAVRVESFKSVVFDTSLSREVRRDLRVPVHGTHTQYVKAPVPGNAREPRTKTTASKMRREHAKE